MSEIKEKEKEYIKKLKEDYNLPADMSDNEIKFRYGLYGGIQTRFDSYGSIYYSKMKNNGILSKKRSPTKKVCKTNVEDINKIYYEKKQKLSPKYSFGKEEKLKHSCSETPGPGQYNPNYNSNSKYKNLPTYTFSKAVRLQYSKNNVPGPGSYKPNYKLLSTYKSSPYWTMGENISKYEIMKEYSKKIYCENCLRYKTKGKCPKC